MAAMKIPGVPSRAPEYLAWVARQVRKLPEGERPGPRRDAFQIIWHLALAKVIERNDPLMKAHVRRLRRAIITVRWEHPDWTFVRDNDPMEPVLFTLKDHADT